MKQPSILRDGRGAWCRPECEVYIVLAFCLYSRITFLGLGLEYETITGRSKRVLEKCGHLGSRFHNGSGVRVFYSPMSLSELLH